MRNRPGQSQAGGKSQGPRSQKAVVPANRLSRDNSNRRILCSGDCRECTLGGRQIRRVAGYYETRAAGSSEVDIGGLVQIREQVGVVFVTQTHIQLQIG